MTTSTPSAPKSVETWHHSPAAQAILASLTADDIALTTYTPICGDKVYHWTAGYQTEKLDAIRLAAINQAFGCDFNAAYEDGRAEDYLEAYNLAPHVNDVLAEMFGEPPHYGSWSDHVSRMIAAAAVQNAMARKAA